MTDFLKVNAGKGWAMPSARAATPSGLSRFASSCLHRIAIAAPYLVAALIGFWLAAGHS